MAEKGDDGSRKLTSSEVIGRQEQVHSPLPLSAYSISLQVKVLPDLGILETDHCNEH
jgi:hypothetical protein